MHPLFPRVIGVAVLAIHLTQAPSAQTQEATPDTLRLEAVLAELYASPVLRAARLGANALASEANGADAWPDPTVSFAVQPFPVYTARGAQRSQLRVEQMLPWPGTLSRRLAVAESAAHIAETEVTVQAADLALEATEAYIRLGRVEAIETILRRYGTRLEAFTEAAAVRYEVGRGTQAAILRLQLEAGGLEARLLPLAAQRQLAGATLARLLDQPELVRASVSIAPIVLPMAADSIFATALFLRPELAVLDAWAARTNAEISLAEWAFYPAIGASLTYFDIASGDIPASADGRNALAVGFTVKVPLDRSSRRADLQAARLRAAQITAEREALETAIVTSVTAHLHHAHHEYEARQLYRTRLLPQAETTVESTLAAYTTGQADFLTLVDAERARFELHIAEAEAETRYLIAAARLARALGVPSVYDLGALR